MSVVTIQNQQFKEYIKYRPNAVNRMNSSVGSRPVYGIPYLRNGYTPFDSRSMLSRDMALDRGIQDSNSRLGESLPSLPRASYMDSQAGSGVSMADVKHAASKAKDLASKYSLTEQARQKIVSKAKEVFSKYQSGSGKYDAIKDEVMAFGQELSLESAMMKMTGKSDEEVKAHIKSKVKAKFSEKTGIDAEAIERIYNDVVSVYNSAKSLIGQEGGSSTLGRLKPKHFKGMGQTGGDFFNDLIKGAEKTIKSVASDVEGAVKAVEGYVSQDDLMDAVGRDIGKAVKVAEDEIESAGKSVINSAEAGTLLSDALKLTGKLTSKYGASAMGTLAGAIVAGSGGGFVGKNIASQLVKAGVSEAGLDKMAGKELKKLGKKAAKKGYGLEVLYSDTARVGHDRRTAGRVVPHYRPYDAMNLTTGDESNRGPRGADAQSFNSLHPMNFRRATMEDVR